MLSLDEIKTNQTKNYPVFSHFQANAMYDAKLEGLSVVVTSSDLGIHSTEAHIHEDHVSFPDGTTLTWDDITRIESDKEV